MDPAQAVSVQVREVLGDVVRNSGHEKLLEIRRSRKDPSEDPLTVGSVGSSDERMLIRSVERENPGEEKN